MKRKTIAALIAVLTIGMSTSVWAAQSISQIIPEAPKTEQGVLLGGGADTCCKECRSGLIQE